MFCARLALILSLALNITQAADELTGRQVDVIRVDGPVVSGTLSGLREQAVQLSLPDQRFSWNDLMAIHWKDRSISRKSADGIVILANGDMLHLNLESLDDEQLAGRWSQFVDRPLVKIPLEAVRGVLFEGGGAAAERLRSLAGNNGHRDRKDLLWLTNGDSLSGQIAALDAKGLTVTTAVGRSTLERSGIRAIAFSSELVSLPALKGPAALVTLVDGSRFHAVGLQLGAIDRIVLRTQFGADLELPLSTVESFRFLGGRTTWLSDLEPADYQFQPFLSLDWPWSKDKSVSGGPLRLRDIDFAKGLGVHSQCELTYRLDGKYRRFQAVAGIDDETAGRGSVVFRVLLDGVSAFESREVTGIDRPMTIGPLDISRARKLTLRVEFASQGDIQDHADWCDAVLVK